MLDNDLVIFNNIIDITSKIVNLYNCLFLEDNHRIEKTDLYNQLLDRLKEELEKEENLYQELDINISKVINCTDYLNIDFEKTMDPVFAVIKYLNNSRNLECMRIVNRLNHKLSDKMSKGDPYSQLFDCIEENVQKVFLYNLEQEVNTLLPNSNFSQVVDYLTKAKYSLSLTSVSAEKYLLDNNFNINDEGYCYFPLLGDFFRIDDMPFYSVNYGKNLIEDCLYHMRLNDYELGDFHNYIRIIISGCYLKSSSMLFLDHKELMEYVLELKNDLKAANRLCDDKFNLSTNYMFNQLDQTIESKNKVKYLSFSCDKWFH